jgi:hypothetical protein
MALVMVAALALLSAQRSEAQDGPPPEPIEVKSAPAGCKSLGVAYRCPNAPSSSS